MIRFIIWLTGIVALAGLFAWAADRPGALTVDWLGYRIETPVPVAAVVLLAAMFLLHAVYGLLRRTWARAGRGCRTSSAHGGTDVATRPCRAALSPSAPAISSWRASRR